MSIRLQVAEILEAVPYNPSWMLADPRWGRTRFQAAQTLRWCESFEYGDPVPADEHEEIVNDLKETLAYVEEELDETQGALKYRSGALKNLEAAIKKWVKGQDDERDDKALIDAWDDYRCAPAK
jgi:hypothetical protein